VHEKRFYAERAIRIFYGGIEKGEGYEYEEGMSFDGSGNRICGADMGA